jgi:hypothetical protein
VGAIETTADDVFAMLATADGSADYRRMMSEFALCRTDALGGRILCCPDCGTRVVEYNRCNHRGCPRCAVGRQQEWRARMTAHILETAHFHLTFSGPDSLVPLWLTDKRRVMDALFTAASSTLSQFAKATKLTFGYTLVFHSHARGLSYKPHIHCLLTAGGVDHHEHWQPWNAIPENSLCARFRTHARRALSLLDTDAARRLVAEETERDWRVYCVSHPQSGGAVVDYFSRTLFGYLIDPRLSHQQTETTITIAETHDGKLTETTLSRGEFIHRYFAHIPPAGATTIRHYGLYSTRLAQLRERLRAHLDCESQTGDTPEEPDTASLEQQLYCPDCQAEMVVGVTFSFDQLPLVLQLYRMTRGSPCPHQHRLSPIHSQETA